MRGEPGPWPARSVWSCALTCWTSASCFLLVPLMTKVGELTILRAKVNTHTCGPFETQARAQVALTKSHLIMRVVAGAPILFRLPRHVHG